MFKPLSIYIGLRYTRAKKRNHFLSFISLASMLGIALGVAVLITVLSVMNGFDREIKNRIFAMVPQVTVGKIGDIYDWQKLAIKIQKEPHVLAVAPFVSSQAMLSNSGEVSGVYLAGILPEKEKLVSSLQDKMILGNMSSLKANGFGVVLGADLAAKLKVTFGDKVTLISPEPSFTPFGIMPRFKNFHVVGIFRVGGGFPYDSTSVFVHMRDAQKMFHLKEKVSGLRVKVDDLYAAPQVTSLLVKKLSAQYSISDWTLEYGALFKAIQMEKTMIFVLLLFIIAVAAFNLVSTLVMAVTDKQSDIAILRTLGASQKTVMGIFMVQGCVVGLIGTLIGVIAGTLLAVNITALVSWGEKFFHLQFINSSVYFIDYLPSELNLMDVVKIGFSALFMSLFATVYPALRASRVRPAEALRYE